MLFEKSALEVFISIYCVKIKAENWNAVKLSVKTLVTIIRYV